jgi:GT2 family glycosyltransferase
MDLSIVIPTLNRLETLEPCLDSVIRNTHVEFEIIVYANSCNPETRALLSTYPCVRTIEDRSNKFFTEAVNTAITQSRGQYVFLLNDDCELRNNRWFPFYKNLADQDDDIAMIGPVHQNLDSLPYGWIEPYASFYRRDILDRIGLLPYYNESFVLWFSDIYHSYRAMHMGLQPIALEPALVDKYVEHKRRGESGDTVLQFRHTLPEKCFEFHGKELMYERLGIRDEKDLAGYYGDRIWGVEDVSSFSSVQL